MSQPEAPRISAETLHRVLAKSLGTPIVRADWQSERLHGGTLGDVQLITGAAETGGGARLSYKVVLKTQKKWERHGDAPSWRREHDLYASRFGELFPNTLRWPECYLAELNGDETRIWMEYIDAASGDALTLDMLEYAAAELGRFQGELYERKPALLRGVGCFGDVDFMKRDYEQWHDQTDEYRYIRSAGCAIPKHLCQMLIEADRGTQAALDKIKRLPVVLCHRDFWPENIFISGERVTLIDWDCAGWGYMGEDVAGLIGELFVYCGRDVKHFEETTRRLVSAFYQGIAQRTDIAGIDNYCIRDMLLLKFGYRIVHIFMFTKSEDKRNQCVNVLQKLYEMGHAHA